MGELGPEGRGGEKEKKGREIEKLTNSEQQARKGEVRKSE